MRQHMCMRAFFDSTQSTVGFWVSHPSTMRVHRGRRHAVSGGDRIERTKPKYTRRVAAHWEACAYLEFSGNTHVRSVLAHVSALATARLAMFARSPDCFVRINSCRIHTLY